MISIGNETLFKVFPFVLLGFIFASYYRFGPWPVPQLVTVLALLIIYFSSIDSSNVYRKDEFGVLFSIILAISIVFGMALKYQGVVDYGWAMPSFILFVVLSNALDLENTFYSTGMDKDSICNKYSFFGLGDDIDWVGYTRATVDKDKDDQMKHMRKLVQKYHPTYCDASCKSQCVFTFNKIQELSKDLINEYY